MTEREIRKGIKELSPLDVYRFLPKIPPVCAECGERNCMAFAAKVVNREVNIEGCRPLLSEKYRKEYAELKVLLAPPVKEVTVGTGDGSVKIGGKLVMYRHEFTYHNLTPIAIDVTDEMPESQVLERVRAVEGFKYNYIGRMVNLDMIAVRSTSDDAVRFATTADTVAKATKLPLILCSLNPDTMEAALGLVYQRRPLIYAATKENWAQMAELALKYNCPLAVFAPNDLNLLRSLANTLTKYGLEELVLDPGTFTSEGLSDTINNFTTIRRNAFKGGDDLLGYPILGTPMTVWLEKDADREVLQWREAYVASMLMSRYADLLIMHSLEGWVLLPNVILRFNLYTDPRKPVSVEPGLKAIGNPNENSPVMFTTNYALTFFTVEADIKSGNVDCYLLVVDTEGLSVESSVAGRNLTAETVAEALKNTDVEARVKHRLLLIPGMAARLSGEIEEMSGWRVLVGPKDSSGIPAFLRDNWPPKKK